MMVRIHELESEVWQLRMEVECKRNKLKAALALIDRLTEKLNAE